MFEGLKKFFGAKPEGSIVRDVKALREWQDDQKNRLNELRKTAAQKYSNLNRSLEERLPEVRNDCTYESQNNGIAKGAIWTHQVSLIGPRGPVLQVVTEDEAYAEALENIWKWWGKKADHNGRLSLAGMLFLGVRTLWTCGEILIQKTTRTDMDEHRRTRTDRARAAALKGNWREVADSISFRLLMLHPRRLTSPMSLAGDNNVVMGVEIDATGRPLQYHIEDADWGGLKAPLARTIALKAKDIIHRYIMEDPEQVRGVPWMACSIDVAGDMRTCDGAVHQAMTLAAFMSVMLHTKHPDANYVEVNEATTLEPGMMSTLPPGWEPTMVKSEHPQTNYVDYRRERLREVGAPVGMPLMMLMKDSSGHNYSSARFDGQVYNESNKVIQAWLSEMLEELVWEVEREAQAMGVLPPRPQDVELVWMWPAPPHVDPKKEADAETINLENGTTSHTAACMRRGEDYETVVKQRARDRKLRELHGEPEPETSKKPVGVDEVDERVDEKLEAASNGNGKTKS